MMPVSVNTACGLFPSTELVQTRLARSGLAPNCVAFRHQRAGLSEFRLTQTRSRANLFHLRGIHIEHSREDARSPRTISFIRPMLSTVA